MPNCTIVCYHDSLYGAQFEFQGCQFGQQRQCSVIIVATTAPLVYACALQHVVPKEGCPNVNDATRVGAGCWSRPGSIQNPIYVFPFSFQGFGSHPALTNGEAPSKTPQAAKSSRFLIIIVSVHPLHVSMQGLPRRISCPIYEGS